MAMLFGLLGRGFSRLGAASGKSSGGVIPPAFSPSLDFSDARNSQYVPLAA